LSVFQLYFLIYTSGRPDTHYLFLLNNNAFTEIYTLSLHDALPIYSIEHHEGTVEEIKEHVYQGVSEIGIVYVAQKQVPTFRHIRSEEHTSELQSRFDLVCRLLLEKKNNKTRYNVRINIQYVVIITT